MIVLPLKQIQSPKGQMRIDNVNRCLRVFSAQLTNALIEKPDLGVHQIILYRSGVDTSSICVICTASDDDIESDMCPLKALVCHALTIDNVGMTELLRVCIGSNKSIQGTHYFSRLNDPDEDWSIVCIIQVDTSKGVTYIPVDTQVCDKFITIPL